MKKSNIFQPTSQYIFICHRSISSSAIAVYIHPPSQYIFIRHRSICSFAIAVYLPKPGQRAAGRKCLSQSETMIKASVFYLQPVLSMQPMTVSVSAPVIPSVLRDREQDDRYRKVRQERSQAAGRSHAAMIRLSFPAFIPYAPLEPFLCFFIPVLHLSSISPLYLSGEPITGLSDKPRGVMHIV